MIYFLPNYTLLRTFVFILTSSIILTFSFSELNINKEFSRPKRFHQTNLGRGAILGAVVPMVCIGASLCIEGYARLPQKFVFPSTPTKIANLPSDKDLVIIFPGVGGPDENIKDLYNRIVYCDKVAGINRFVCCYDWSQWVGNLIRAAYDSEAVGKVIGEQVAEDVNTNPRWDKEMRNVHCIGISVGAFAANSFLRTITKKTSKLNRKVYRRLTLLDPFTSKGIFGLAYGPRQFGLKEHTDYFENYLNSDDPVPSTNEPLPNGVTYDVTYAMAKKDFVPLPGDSMHSWPVAYLSQRWVSEVDKRGRLAQPKHDDHPTTARGNVIRIM